MISDIKTDIKTSERMNYLDALRAFVMSMGVVLHASLTAGTDHWLPRAIATFSHLFRMKLFLILSGYFIALQAARLGVRAVQSDRIRRLGIPILVFILIFNPITIYIRNLEEYNYPEFFYYIINMPSRTLDTNGAGWHLHLWFLIILLCYCAALAAIYFIVNSKAAKYIFYYINNLSNSKIILILSIGTSSLFVAGRIVHFLTFQKILHGGPLNYIVQAATTYFPFFVLGIVMYKYKRIFVALHTIAVVQAGISFAILAFVWMNIASISSVTGFAASEAVQHFSQELAGFYICCIFLMIFSRYVNNKNSVIRFLADSSYTVYLFHVFILACLNFIFRQFMDDPFTIYVTLIIPTYLICLLIHRYIVMSTPLSSFLFNGKSMKKS